MALSSRRVRRFLVHVAQSSYASDNDEVLEATGTSVVLDSYMVVTNTYEHLIFTASIPKFQVFM
jgi:hypothetical protein